MRSRTLSDVWSSNRVQPHREMKNTECRTHHGHIVSPSDKFHSSLGFQVEFERSDSATHSSDRSLSMSICDCCFFAGYDQATLLLLVHAGDHCWLTICRYRKRVTAASTIWCSHAFAWHPKDIDQDCVTIKHHDIRSEL